MFFNFIVSFFFVLVSFLRKQNVSCMLDLWLSFVVYVISCLLTKLEAVFYITENISTFEHCLYTIQEHTHFILHIKVTV